MIIDVMGFLGEGGYVALVIFEGSGSHITIIHFGSSKVKVVQKCVTNLAS